MEKHGKMKNNHARISGRKPWKTFNIIYAVRRKFKYNLGVWLNHSTDCTE